jgi:two-component system chemotaxis response regulator CheB
VTGEHHVVVVIGGPSGSIGAMTHVAAALPVDFPAVVCVTLHQPPHSRSPLPEVLSSAGVLRAVQPENGERMERGRIYVAPPDRHLLIDDDRAYVRHGPKENRHRPAIDALFRSAAVMLHDRVIAVLLTGSSTYDGVTGLTWVKRFGGVAIVQDPDEGAIRTMPTGAAVTFDADYVLPAADIGPVLVQLVGRHDASPPPHALSEKSHADEPSS